MVVTGQTLATARGFLKRDYKDNRKKLAKKRLKKIKKKAGYVARNLRWALIKKRMRMKDRLRRRK